MENNHSPVERVELTATQEAIALALSKNLLLPLNDLLVVVQAFVHPNISLSALARCLRKHKTAAGKEVSTQGDESQLHYQTFKSYDVGFIHLNSEPLPALTDGQEERSLLIATDRATHWVYCEVCDTLETTAPTAFLHRLAEVAPFKITRVLTEESERFTDGSRERKPTGLHPFDVACKKWDIQHLLAEPTPPTLKQISADPASFLDAIKQSRYFQPDENLDETLKRYVTLYNEEIAQINLDHATPSQALKKWFENESATMRTKKAFKLSGVQLLMIWIGWLAITLFFASQAMNR
ncbi:MAG: IS481 family transposase [Magnetococcales bacterium]|nr:IS481 family transposase [Magnetococcales bacterium]